MRNALIGVIAAGLVSSATFAAPAAHAVGEGELACLQTLNNNGIVVHNTAGANTLCPDAGPGLLF